MTVGRERIVVLILVVLLMVALGCRSKTEVTFPSPTPVKGTLVETRFPAVTPTIPVKSIENTSTPSPSNQDDVNQKPTALDESAPLLIEPELEIVPKETKVIISVAEGVPTPETPIPTQVPVYQLPGEVITILLAGNDVAWPQGGRTDTLIVVAINTKTKTVSLLSIPRDLYVYIPDWTMNRINLALPHGHGADYPGGGGGLAADTIQYNLGIPVHHYARAGFGLFKDIVDTFDGVEVIVNCPLTDWRLKSPELDPEIEENWEMFTLEPGVHLMDGDLALWYVRSRKTTNDFDRNRRQQQMIAAIFKKGIDVNALSKLPSLWDSMKDQFETDLTLAEVVRLGAIAPQVYEGGFDHFVIPAEARRPWRVPVTGEAVQLLDWQEADLTLQQFVSEPALRRGRRPPIKVKVFTKNMIAYRQAVDNLKWFGFLPEYGGTLNEAPTKSNIFYYGQSLKGAFADLLAWQFDMTSEQIEISSSEFGLEDDDYHVYLGSNYDPCRPIINTPPLNYSIAVESID